MGQTVKNLPVMQETWIKFLGQENSSGEVYDKDVMLLLLLLLLLLNRLSHVQLCAPPQMAAHQAPHPWDSPGKNTGVGCHFLTVMFKNSFHQTYL